MEKIRRKLTALVSTRFFKTVYMRTMQKILQIKELKYFGISCIVLLIVLIIVVFVDVLE